MYDPDPSSHSSQRIVLAVSEVKPYTAVDESIFLEIERSIATGDLTVHAGSLYESSVDDGVPRNQRSPQFKIVEQVRS